MLTHRTPRPAGSVWDEVRIEAAQKLGYTHPERHGTYIQHQHLPTLGDGRGWLLVGRAIDLRLAAAADKAGYRRVPRISLAAPAPSFMAELRLAGAGQLDVDVPRIPTPFGDLNFLAQELSKGPGR